MEPVAPGGGGAGGAGGAPASGEFSFSHLHGFNLLGHFHRDWSNEGYRRDEFVAVRDLGFNYVRLPIDYRSYTAGDWLTYDETTLKNLDNAVAWGQELGVHVTINLHRGPGYTVADPKEPTSLWTDADTQAVFLAHWQMLAERYRDVPPEALSFNLVNEPSGVDDATYGNVMRPVIETIRAITPERPVISDGLDYCKEPAQSIADLDVVQAFRGYTPFQVSHYQASWVEGSDTWEVPVWPPAEPALASHFYGASKPAEQSDLVVDHTFGSGAEVGIHVQQVSHEMTLNVLADGTLVDTLTFTPGPGDGDWSEVIYAPEWDVYQNIYDREYTVSIPAGTQQLTISPQDGDWLTISSLRLTDSSGDLTFSPNIVEWGAQQTHLKVEGGLLLPLTPTGVTGRDVLLEYLEPWLAYRDAGGTIFAGEFGAHNRTPHDVTLAWMSDMLTIYQEESIGWALWNLEGSFGIIDSQRADVSYVPFTWDSGQTANLDQGLLDVLVAGLPPQR